MSSVSSASVTQSYAAARNVYKYDREKRPVDGQDPDDADVVEISAEARAKMQAGQAAEEEAVGGLLHPAKKIKPGSESYDVFRKLMDRVKNLKLEITTQIEDALEKAGVSLSGSDKLKIEIDSSGAVMVGGIADKKTAAAVEAALNKDKSLAKKIADYQVDERELSRQMKDYTGCTLYELTMTCRGDISDRIRNEVEDGGTYDLGNDYFMRLGFLDADNPVVTPDDIAALSFDGALDFSAEINVMSDPEGNIKNTLETMRQEIQAAFDALNAELTERLRADGVDVDDERLAGSLLDIANASITFDSQGGVTVSGSLSEDARVHRRGVEIIEEIFRKALTEVGDNSYHVNIFSTACQSLTDRDGAELGLSKGQGAKVFATLAGGSAGDIRIEPYEKDAKLSPMARDLAAKIEEAIGRSRSRVLR